MGISRRIFVHIRIGLWVLLLVFLRIEHFSVASLLCGWHRAVGRVGNAHTPFSGRG